MRIEVKSSLLKSVAYNPSTRELEVEFKAGGKVYRYSNVSQETYDQFVSAESLGKFFLKEIKPAYACKRVEEEKEDAAERSMETSS